LEPLAFSKLCISCIILYLGLFVLQPEPKIQYTLKAVGGSLTAIPGLSDMIDVMK
jgi:hypothetical protein